VNDDVAALCPCHRHGVGRPRPAPVEAKRVATPELEGADDNLDFRQN